MKFLRERSFEHWIGYDFKLRDTRSLQIANAARGVINEVNTLEDQLPKIGLRLSDIYRQSTIPDGDCKDYASYTFSRVLESCHRDSETLAKRVTVEPVNSHVRIEVCERTILWKCEWCDSATRLSLAPQLPFILRRAHMPMLAGH